MQQGNWEEIGDIEIKTFIGLFGIYKSKNENVLQLCNKDDTHTYEPIYVCVCECIHTSNTHTHKVSMCVYLQIQENME